MYTNATQPQSRPPAPLRALLSLTRDPLAFLTEIARTQGDLATLAIGGRTLVLLNHPDHIRELLVTHHRSFVKGPALQRARRLLGDGLLTSEGAAHMAQRRALQPAFHRERVAAYATTMVRWADQRATVWQHGSTVNVAEEMMELTLAIVGETLFGADLSASAADVGVALTALMRGFRVLNLPFGPQLLQLPLPFARRVRRAEATLDRVIAQLLAERAAGSARGDLLAMLIEGHAGAATNPRQVRDDALTLFLAGHETTANALTWTWYLLAAHPEAAAALHAELAIVLRGRLPTAADVPLLPYTRAVFAEAMRLYPPAWVVGRQAVEPVTIGGREIKVGTTVLASQWLVHRDPRWWSDPLRFVPARWFDTAVPAHKLAYFPFGAGPRMCIGEGFAWTEGVLLLATLAQRWQLTLDPTQVIALQPAVTLRPRHGMRMRLSRRTDPPIVGGDLPTTRR